MVDAEGLKNSSQTVATTPQPILTGERRRTLLTLSTAVCIAVLSLGIDAPAFGFQTFEHFYVGQVAYEQACGIGNPLCTKISTLFEESKDNKQAWDNASKSLCSQQHFLRKVASDLTGFNYRIRSWHRRSWKTAQEELAKESTCEARGDDREQQKCQNKDAIPLGFGDLSALAGDFTADPCDLEDMVHRMITVDADVGIPVLLATRRHYVASCQWLKQSCSEKDPAEKDPECIELRCNQLLSPANPTAKILPWPTRAFQVNRTEDVAFERLPAYTSLAINNQEHFPMHSWANYRDYHDLALTHASLYKKTTDESELLQALITEGFAQHFLQDSFAAGHIGSAWGKQPPWANWSGSWSNRDLEFNPNRLVLQRGHDFFNENGLAVRMSTRDDQRIPTPLATQTAPTGEWTAYGDNSLLTLGAKEHRRQLLAAATLSLKEVFDATGKSTPITTAQSQIDHTTQSAPQVLASSGSLAPMQASSRSVSQTTRNPRSAEDPKVLATPYFSNEGTFPIPTTLPTNLQENLSTLANKQLTAAFPDFLPECPGVTPGSDKCDLVKWESSRSPDFRVPDQFDEGWKVSVAAGTAFGRVAKLVPQSVINNESEYPPPPVRGKSESHKNGAELVEIGYLRSTSPIAPNYLAVNAKLVNNARVEVLPLVAGWFFLPESRLYYFGFLTELGVRIENPYLKTNPSTSQKYSLLFGVPLEVGAEIYPPITFFLRADAFQLNASGLGTDSPTSAKGYPFYLGYTTVMGGLRLSLTGISQ